MENSILHNHSHAFCSLCGHVVARAPHRKTTTSCLSSRRIAPAHHHVLPWQQKKSFSAGHGSVFRSERDTSKQKPGSRAIKTPPIVEPESSNNKAHFGELRRRRSRVVTVETNVNSSQGFVAFNLPTSTFFVKKVFLSKLISVLAWDECRNSMKTRN